MNYISTPIDFGDTLSSILPKRDLDSQAAMLDNLIELIAFTPRGSCSADPEFGFEYWNHEYVNIEYSTFNNGQVNTTADGTRREITKNECQDSIKRSLSIYAPQLKNAYVSVELNPADVEHQHRKKVQPKHLVSITVKGDLDSGISMKKYEKKVVFLMEPTTKCWINSQFHQNKKDKPVWI